jgi:hypothetical protein
MEGNLGDLQSPQNDRDFTTAFLLERMGKHRSNEESPRKNPHFGRPFPKPFGCIKGFVMARGLRRGRRGLEEPLPL